MSNYNLFIDDFRHPYDAFLYTKDTRYAKLKWITVKSYDEFVKVIKRKGIPNIVSFDHDLADSHYARNDNPWSTENSIDYFSFEEKTGYECAKWLCDFCLDNSIKFPEYLIHSMNTVGSSNIKNYIDNYIKHCEK